MASIGEGTIPTSARFVFLEPIGYGGLGRVVRAHDRLMGRDVAAKALSVSGPDEVHRLKREFRALSGIAHPNLVELYDLFIDEQTRFFTMELLDGKNFLEHVRGADFVKQRGAAPSAPTSAELDGLRVVLLQLARGLAALHGAGRIHRDIKPDNVRVTSAGRVVLLDFGLATSIRPGANEEEDGEGFVGSPDYVAPEQAWNQSLSAATDWYGFGVMLYEALTGRLPFEGPPARTLVARTKKPPPPTQWVPSLDPDLAKLASRLLEPSPDKRAGYAEILALLGAPAGRTRDISSSPPFVGRGAELSRLLDILQKDRPAIVHVLGPSGIGKTTLLDEAAWRLEEAPDVLLLRGRCHPSEAIPHRGADGVIDSLCRWLSTQEDVMARIPADAAALARLFPAFRRLPAWDEACVVEPALPAAERRRRAIGTLRELLSGIATNRKISIFIEDMHFCDEDSVALLADLMRPPLAPPLRLVLAYREGAASERLLAPLRGDDGLAWTEVHHVPLGPLGRDEIIRLASAMWTSGERDLEENLDAIVRETEGNPFLVSEAALRPKRDVAAANDEPRWSRFDLERLATLSPKARRLLDVVVVAGRPVQRGVAFSAAGIDEREDCGAFVAELRMQRLLSGATGEGAASFDVLHDRVRQAILAVIPRDTRRAIHRDIVAALERRPDPDLDSVLEHLLGAGETAAAQRLVLDAAERAAGALAWGLAARRFELALDIGATGKPRHVILERQAAAFALSGQTEGAARAYKEAALALERIGGARPSVLALLRASAEQHLRGGKVEQGIALLRDVLERTAISWPSGRAASLASIVASRAQIAWLDPTRPRRSRSSPTPEELRTLDAYWSAGLGLNMIDLLRSAVFQARHAVLAFRLGEPSHAARAMATEISYRACEGAAQEDRASSARLEGAATMTARSARDAESLAFVELCIGAARYFEGRFREAIAAIDGAEHVFHRHHEGITWEVANCWTYRIWSLSWLGELREMAALLPSQLAEIRTQRNRLTLGSITAAHGNLLWLAADRPRDATARADEAVAPFAGGDFKSPHYFDLVARVRVDLYEGRGKDAARRIAAAWPGLGSSGLLRMRFFRVELRALRLSASIAAASEGGEGRAGFLELAEEDAKALARENHRMAPPLAALGRAGLLGLSGDLPRARRSLAEAALACERADLHLHATAARARLGREDALASLESQGVLRPRRFSEMLVPSRFSP